MLPARVAQASQAALLLSVELRPLLKLLMRGPHAVSEVAALLDISVQRAHYLLRKLAAAEVAAVVGERRRKGPAVKLYQIAQPWFIPFEVTASESLEALANAQVQPRIEQLVQETLRVFVQHTGEQRGSWLSETNLSLGDATGPAEQLWEGEEPLLFTMGELHVAPEKAAEFKRRLMALAEEFGSPLQTPDSRYLFAAFLVRTEART